MPPEAWLNGPVHGVPSLFQPVAHALVQARADVTEHAPVRGRRGAGEIGLHPRERERQCLSADTSVAILLGRRLGRFLPRPFFLLGLNRLALPPARHVQTQF